MLTHQIPDIIQALLNAGATKGNDEIEWVYENDDGGAVKGPDGVAGWFNDSKYAFAVERYDAATVRAVMDVFWMFERFRFNNMEDQDAIDLEEFVVALNNKKAG